MGLVSLALLPARAVVATADVLVAVRDLAAPTGPIRREGGYGERLAAVADALELLAESTTSLPELPERVLAVETQVTSISAQLGRLEPALEALGSSVGSLKDSAHQLSGVVVPLGRMIERLPGGRRRPQIEDGD